MHGLHVEVNAAQNPEVALIWTPTRTPMDLLYGSTDDLSDRHECAPAGRLAQAPWFLAHLERTAYNPEACIRRRTFRGIGAPRGDAVTVAVAGMAKEGAAANDPVGSAGRPERIFSFAGRTRERRPEVGAPFPDVACNLVETVAIRRKGPYGTGPVEPVLSGVRVRKRPLPDVAHVGPARGQLVSPWIASPHHAATGRGFPLGLCGQANARPFAECLRVVPRDMHDWMISLKQYVAATTRRPAPVCISNLKPPGRTIDAPANTSGDSLGYECVKDE